MARTSLKAYASDFAIINSDNPSDHQSIVIPGPNMLWTNYDDSGKWMLCKFDDLTSILGNLRLYEVKAVFQVGRGSATNARIWPLKTDYDKDTVTYNNAPEIDSDAWPIFNSTGAVTTDQDITFWNASGQSLTAKRYIQACAAEFRPIGKSYQFNIYTVLTDNTLPYFEIFYDDTAVVASQIVYKSGPAGGYNNPRNATDIRWDYEKSGEYYCAKDFIQASATFFWKESGDESYTAVQISGSTKGVTIPANTFPVNKTIEWYLQGTDTAGTVSQTSVYSFSTSAATVYSTPISPRRTVESKNSEITFKWSYSSDDGFAPSRYVFRWKLASDSSWTTAVDSTNVVDEYTFPANTFLAGEIQWGVVPFNIDGVQGEAQTTSFLCIGAPDAPIVYATDTPFSTITWQASDQQGYQIMVDSTIYGPYFGSEKSFDISDKLEDGEHQIRVAIIGTYGLWSEWGTTAVSIQNVPGEEIVLSGTSGIDNLLLWTTEEATSNIMIFRDGVQIGHTTGNSFNDRLSVGEHTYKVINRLADGNYSESNQVVLNAEADGTYISLLSGGEWLKIKHSLKTASDPEYTESVETVHTHLAGDNYPSVAISNYRERSLKYSAVFLFVNEADHKKFKSMLRHPVIMKFKNGNMIVGVLNSWTVVYRKRYYTSYVFTIRQIEWEDYVDDTT